MKDFDMLAEITEGKDMNHLGHLAGPSHDAEKTGEKKRTILGGLIVDDNRLQQAEQAHRHAQLADLLRVEGADPDDNIFVP